jgi:hypothetical protein
MTNKNDDRRKRDISKVARDELHIELDMQHKDTRHPLTATEIRRALEAAYDLGRKSGLS